MAGVVRQGFFGPGEARATSISRSGSVRSEQRSPGAKRTAALWVAPSLACGFVARRSQPHCGGCSLLSPRHRPNWAQQNTSHLGDTTLVDGFLLSPEEGGAAAASTLTEEEAIVFPAP